MDRAVFSVRLPEGLKEWLRQRAEANCRTMNGELLALLKATQSKDETQSKVG
jgi:plasmid stability protein